MEPKKEPQQTVPEQTKHHLFQQWALSKESPKYERPCGMPVGIRAPNDLMWGNSISDFFHVILPARSQLTRVWSRSMIKELEALEEFGSDDPMPYQTKPWPILTVNGGQGQLEEGTSVESGLDVIMSDGSDHDDAYSSDSNVEQDFELDYGQDDHMYMATEIPTDLEPNECIPPFGPDHAETVLDGVDLPTSVVTEADPDTAALKAEAETTLPTAEAKHQHDVNVDAGCPTTYDQSKLMNITLEASKPEELHKKSATSAPLESSDDPVPDSAPLPIAQSQLFNNALIDAYIISNSAETTSRDADPFEADKVSSPPEPESPSPAIATTPEAALVAFQDQISKHNYYCLPVHQCGYLPTDGAGMAPSPPQAESLSIISQMIQEEAFRRSKRALNPDTWSHTAEKGFNFCSAFTGTPKLEEFIPEEYMPDFLIVYDPDFVATKLTGMKMPTGLGGFKRYKRLYPERSSLVTRKDQNRSTATSGLTPESDDTSPSAPPTAHLYLEKSAQIGSGHHSYVFRAPLVLPSPLSARSPNGQVTVAVKVALRTYCARELLENEAKMYNGFPRHMQEEWSGFNMLEELKSRPVPVGPVVPKFYGYYVPDEAEETIQNGSYEAGPTNMTETKHTPILLLEECGKQIEPDTLTIEARLECYSLLLRLHHEGILQQSVYIRNMLVQPGPLSLPPEERSLETPSFRIIDFGRGQTFRGLGWYAELEVKDEMNRAQRELKLKSCHFQLHVDE